MDRTNPTATRLILQKIPIFSDLAEDELDTLVGLLKQREFPKEGTILNRDEPGDALYMIVSGQVKVVLYGENGREIILSMLREGDFFGEMSLLDGAPRSASVVAQSNSKILVLERKEFVQQLVARPKIGVKILEEMSRRLRDADEKIGTLALYDVYGRLARLLIHMAKNEGTQTPEGVVIEKRPTHQDIAAMIGTSRETVSRALSDFARRGFVQLSGKQIVISPAALQELEDQGGS